MLLWYVRLIYNQLSLGGAPSLVCICASLWLLTFLIRAIASNTNMSTPTGSVRNRKDAKIQVKAKDAFSTGIAAPRDAELDQLVKENLAAKGSGSEWDYKIALTIITLLAFVTRFWGISHPNEVVFDEVHFGKVEFLILAL